MYTEIEKDAIRRLIGFDFTATIVGGAFLLKEIFCVDDGVYLFYNPSWGDGKYKIYITPTVERNRSILFRYISIFNLINKLIDEKLIIVIPANYNKKNAFLLHPSITETNFSWLNVELDTYFKNEIEIKSQKDITATLNPNTGIWSVGVSHDHCATELCSYDFDNGILPLEHFLNGMVFVSPELDRLVNADFETMDEKKLNLAISSLGLSKKTLETAQFTLEEAKNSVSTANATLAEVKENNSIALETLKQAKTNVSIAVDLLSNLKDNNVITKSSLVEAKNSVILAKETLSAVNKSNNIAKNSLNEARDSSKTANKSITIAIYSIIISMLLAATSIIVSIWAENKSDNVTVLNPTDSGTINSIDAHVSELQEQIDSITSNTLIEIKEIKNSLNIIGVKLNNHLNNSK